jgi:glycerophosphoryl diester phosphodiesterase
MRAERRPVGCVAERRYAPILRNMAAHPITLVAHRGNAAELPANTLPAFESALALGVSQLALDVQLAGDAVPMVVRDPELRRLGAGRDGSLLDLSSGELARLEVAERERFGDRHAGVCIPRLADLVPLLRSRPDATLFVTLQRASLARHGHRRVVRAVLEALEPLRRQCVLVSREFAAVVEARREGAGDVGWILAGLDPHAQLKCEALQPQFLCIEAAQLPATARPWLGPWQWAVLDVLTPGEARDFARRGLHWIHTPRVRAMARELGVARAPRPHAATADED